MSRLRIFDDETRARIAAAIDQQEAAQAELIDSVVEMLPGHQREAVFAELIDTMGAVPDHACTAAAIAILTLAEQQHRRADT